MAAQKSLNRKNRLPAPIPIACYDENVQQIESTTLTNLSQTDNVNLSLPSPLNIGGCGHSHFSSTQDYGSNHYQSYRHNYPQPLSLPTPQNRAENSSEVFYNNLLKTDSFIDKNSDYNNKIHCLEYHKDTVLCVTKCQFLNQDQKLTEYIFSGSQDASIGVWNTDTFQLKGTLLGHSRSILNLYVINDTIMNPLLLSTSRDNTICIWDIKTLSLLFRITGLPSLVYDIEVLSFPKNGGYYLYGCCQDTNIFSLSLSILPYLMRLQFEKLKIMDQHKKQMAAFKKKSKSKLNSKSSSKTKLLNRNGTEISNNDNDLNVLNDLLLLNKPSILSPAGFKQTWIEEEEEQEQDETVSELHVNHNDESSSIKSGSVSPSKIIEVKMNFELPASTNEIREIISTDPTVKFLSKSINEIIDIYYDLMIDEEEQEENNQNNDKHMIHKIFGGCHHGFIFRMKQIRNEYKLITGGSDAAIKIWDVSDKCVKLLSVLTGHSHSVIDFDLMGNEYLITASRDETLKVWNIDNINKPHTRYTMNGHTIELTAIKVIHNGSLIVSASRDGMVKFWDGKSYQCINTFMIDQGKSSVVTNKGEDMNGFENSSSIKSPNILHKAWTCDADQLERDKPNCVMKFDFMEPSWLLLCDTAYRVEIWDIAPLLKLSPNEYATLSVNNGNRINAYLPALSPKKESEQKFEQFGNNIESILNGLGLSEYIENFKQEKVDYDTLFYLSGNDLIQLDIPLGPRKKILRYIEQKKLIKNGGNYQNDKRLKLTAMMVPQRSDPKNALFGGPHLESYNIIADLSKFIAFKSISCRSKYQSECWNAAYFIQNKTEQFGAETRLVQGAVGKNPVVLAKFTNNLNINASSDKDNLVRIVMYGHYDVVDINNESGWTSPPFKLTGKNGYLYGRGTTDNKGPILVFLYAIRELLEELQDNIDNNKNDLSLEFVMILEGQEEYDWNNGGLKEVVEKNMDWLENPKVIICSNSYWVGDKVPCLVYGMRGHCRINVKVTGSKQDCHSGVHGGAFSEPIFDLISVLSKIKDPKTNKILIPGFYDNILPLKSDETQLYDEIVATFNTDSYLKSIGFDANTRHICTDKNREKDKDKGDEKEPHECDKALLMQKWRNPSLSIHNIQQSSNECTVISKSASAVISIRSVPNQNNMDIIDLCNKYLLNIFDGLSTYNSIHISHNNIGSHWLMDYNNHIFKCAEKAIIKHWQIKPYYIREGGNIPCINYLNKKLNCPILQFPLGQSTDRAHLENERIRLQNLSKGKDVIKSFLINLIKHHQQQQK